MPYTAFSYLVLPRLHPELADDVPHPLPEGTLFLWPGLPHPPSSGVFLPDYAWSPAQAAACVADFERAGREGAHGAPVEAFSVASVFDAGHDLSPEELRALRELMGKAASPPSPVAEAEAEARRQAAQRVLLLAWLQEKQALELRHLERRVRLGQAALAGLLGEGAVTAPEADGEAGDAPLPAWRSVLAAACVFLPHSSAGERGEEAAVLAADRDMASALDALASDAVAEEGVPPGFRAVRAPLGRVLGRGRATPDTERSLLFLYPSTWA